MYTVPMALVDYIPVACFAVAAVILMRDLYNKMSKGAFALFAAGTIDVAFAGFLKATYKLLYAANICDFSALSATFFPLQSLGFLLAGIGAFAMIVHKQTDKTAMLAAVPPAFTGTPVFVTLMIAGLGFLDFALCYLSKKIKKPAIIALFVLSFVGSLAMGYLSSKNFADPNMNWIAEFVNVLAQGALLIGAIMLHKNGLADLKLEKTK